MDGLERFRRAQAEAWAGFDTALAEIRSGRKRSHWIWYIFPQLAGLGTSDAARTYGLKGVDEAAAYLRDDELRQRLVTIVEAVASRLKSDPHERLEALMGSSIDTQKLVSSLTLFGRVAEALHLSEGLEAYAALVASCEEVLSVAESQGYPPCRFTLERMGARG
jgi:uncharacterized protein (DUF1810 family)